MADPKDKGAKGAEPAASQEPHPRMTVPDKHGAHWVHLTRDEVRAHPQGRPGPVLWAIALWFAASGAGEVALVQAAGAPLWSGIMGVLSLVAGVGLLLSVPWAYVLAVLLPARFIIGFAQTVGGGGETLAGMGQAGQVLVLAQAMIAVAVMFHLVEGERPNLIYRRRFRSYSAEREVEAAEAKTDSAEEPQ